MSSILNVSYRRDSSKYTPTIVNNVNVSSKFDRIQHTHQRQKSREISIPEIEKDIPSNSEQKTEKEDIVVIYPENDISSDAEKDIQSIEHDKQQKEETMEKMYELAIRKCRILETYIDLIRNRKGEYLKSKLILDIGSMVKLLAVVLDTNEEDISLDIEEDVGCFGSRIQDISTIYANIDNVRKDISLIYPDEITLLKQLGIDISRVITA